MAKLNVNRVLLVLSLTGGLLTALSFIFMGYLFFLWDWILSGGQGTQSLPKSLTMFHANSGMARELRLLILAFIAGVCAVNFVSRLPPRPFIQTLSISSGWPRNGFLFGLLCGIVSCVLLSSLVAVEDILFDSSKHAISIGLLLFGILASPIMALFLMGIPIGLIGGIVGSAAELVLRRICRTSEPPKPTPNT